MKSEDKKKLDVHYAQNRKIEESLDGGAAAEKAMLNKEVLRMQRESANFEKSKASIRTGLMKFAFVIAGISVVLNLVLGGAIAAMMPLKTVEPYLLYVDTSTGHAEVRQPLEEVLPTYGEEADKYFIEQYVMARESYDWGLAQRNYLTVQIFSWANSSVFNEYDNFIKSEKSPLTILGDRSRVVVNIRATSIDTATSTTTIRFTKTVVGPDGRPSTTLAPTHWIATARYEYPNPKLKPEERRLNPLGMKITSYQLVQERVRGEL